MSPSATGDEVQPDLVAVAHDCSVGAFGPLLSAQKELPRNALNGYVTTYSYASGHDRLSEAKVMNSGTQVSDLQDSWTDWIRTVASYIGACVEAGVAVAVVTIPAFWLAGFAAGCLLGALLYYDFNKILAG